MIEAAVWPSGLRRWDSERHHSALRGIIPQCPSRLANKPDRIIVIQFADKEKVYTWLSSPEYKAIAGLRAESVESEAIIVEEDQMSDYWRAGKNHNPWRDFPHDIYVKHMGHESVGQLEMRSRIVSEQLALVTDMPSPVIAMLGITDGNGLCNVEPGRYKAIIGIDINTGETHQVIDQSYKVK